MPPSLRQATCARHYSGGRGGDDRRQPERLSYASPCCYGKLRREVVEADSALVSGGGETD